jgi:4-amino-4-deoxy-L-arabinose transferase-like glycosyltransferase
MVFNSPWWLFCMVGLVGVALLISGNKRQKKPLLAAGVAVLALLAVLVSLNYFIVTPREKVTRATRAIVEAAVKRDRATLDANLHPNASLALWNRKQIIDGAATYADRFGLTSASISGWDIKEDQPHVITVTIRVIARFTGQNLPYDTVPTDWQLNWWETNDGKWLLKDIIPMGGGNLSGDRMSKQYFTNSP